MQNLELALLKLFSFEAFLPQLWLSPKVEAQSLVTGDTLIFKAWRAHQQIQKILGEAATTQKQFLHDKVEPQEKIFTKSDHPEKFCHPRENGDPVSEKTDWILGSSPRMTEDITHKNLSSPADSLNIPANANFQKASAPISTAFNFLKEFPITGINKSTLSCAPAWQEFRGRMQCAPTVFLSLGVFLISLVIILLIHFIF